MVLFDCLKCLKRKIIKIKKKKNKQDMIRSIIKILGDLVWDSQAIKALFMKCT